MKLIAQLFLTTMFILTGVSAYNSVKKASMLDYDYKFSTSLVFESIDAKPTTSIQVSANFVKLEFPEKKEIKRHKTPKQKVIKVITEEALTPEKIVIKPDTIRTRRKLKMMIRRLSDSEVVNRNL